MVRSTKNNSPATSATNVIRDATWRGRQLFLGRKLLATIVPDSAWSGLWRVHLLDGHVSDLVNLSRAKDRSLFGGGARKPSA
jgi:hypothetical protein